MARIVAKYKADGNATDPVRVLRVPGFFHRKGDPVRVRLAHCAGASYSTEEIVKAFPPVKSVAPKPRVVQPQPDIDLEALRSALEHLAATPISNKPNAGTYVDDYETWMRFGLALKRDLGEEGFDIWEEWSEYSERYPGRDTLRAKWEKGFKTDDDDGGYGHCVRPIHVGSIFFTAQRRGWSTTRFRIAKALTDARGAFA